MTNVSSEAMNVVYDWLLSLSNEELKLAWDEANPYVTGGALLRYQILYTVKMLQKGLWQQGVLIHDQTRLFQEPADAFADPFSG